MDTHSGSLFPGSTRKRKLNDSHSPQNTEDADDSWVDVYKNIKRMDTLYDATFYNWLKSEDNVVVISMYLHRIANQYPLPRIINALKWLIRDWRLESIAVLVKQVTVDWKGNEGDSRRGTLLSQMTYNWATQFTASLIASILTAPPYTTSTSYVASITTINAARQRFLKALTNDYDFSKLSEFLMFLGSQLSLSSSSSSSVVGCVRSSNGDGITVGGTVASSSTFSFSSSSNQSIQHEHIEPIELEHKIKVALLKDAARREREKEAELEEKIARRCREWRERGSDREGGEAKRLKLSDESKNTRARVIEHIGNSNNETSASITPTLSIRTREQLVSDAGHSEDGLIVCSSSSTLTSTPTLTSSPTALLSPPSLLLSQASPPPSLSPSFSFSGSPSPSFSPICPTQSLPVNTSISTSHHRHRTHSQTHQRGSSSSSALLPPHSNPTLLQNITTSSSSSPSSSSPPPPSSTSASSSSFLSTPTLPSSPPSTTSNPSYSSFRNFSSPRMRYARRASYTCNGAIAELGESGEGVAVVIGSSNSHGHGHTFGGQASHDCQSIETAVPSQEGLTKSVPSNDGSISGNEMIL